MPLPVPEVVGAAVYVVLVALVVATLAGSSSSLGGVGTGGCGGRGCCAASSSVAGAGAGAGGFGGGLCLGGPGSSVVCAVGAVVGCCDGLVFTLREACGGVSAGRGNVDASVGCVVGHGVPRVEQWTVPALGCAVGGDVGLGDLDLSARRLRMGAVKNADNGVAACTVCPRRKRATRRVGTSIA